MDKDKLDFYSEQYFSNSLDFPYELKQGGVLMVKPILLKDYSLYSRAVGCLTLPKNEQNDIRILQMSYLDYLHEIVESESKKDEKNRPILTQLQIIVQLCFGYDYIGFQSYKNKMHLLLLNEKGEIDKIIRPSELDDLIEIILNQNDAHYDNRTINPEVKKLMEEYYSLKYRDISLPSLEKRKAFVCSKIGKTFKELSNYTYREFDEIYKAMLDSEIYLATKITEASYKYEVKEQTKHPIYEPEKDRFEEIFSDLDTLENKGLKGVENIGQELAK